MALLLVGWMGDAFVWWWCMAFVVDVDAAIEVDWSNRLALVDAGAAECCCVTPRTKAKTKKK